MIEYNKIDTIFERDDKTKKLIRGKFRDNAVEFCKDLTWQFTEKVDGTNIRIYWDGHKVQIAGRTDNAQIPGGLLKRLNELFAGEVNEEMFEQKFGGNEVYLFGEGYGEKIQTNGYIDGNDFILFDVMINGKFLERENVEEIAQYFKINVVPIILEGKLEDGVNWVLNNRTSLIAKKGANIEGLVARLKVELQDRNGKRLITKIKYRDFFNY
jgi:hypothetical protein